MSSKAKAATNNGSRKTSPAPRHSSPKPIASSAKDNLIPSKRRSSSNKPTPSSTPKANSVSAKENLVPKGANSGKPELPVTGGSSTNDHISSRGRSESFAKVNPLEKMRVAGHIKPFLKEGNLRGEDIPAVVKAALADFEIVECSTQITSAEKHLKLKEGHEVTVTETQFLNWWFDAIWPIGISSPDVSRKAQTASRRSLTPRAAAALANRSPRTSIASRQPPKAGNHKSNGQSNGTSKEPSVANVESVPNNAAVTVPNAEAAVESGDSGKSMVVERADGEGAEVAPTSDFQLVTESLAPTPRNSISLPANTSLDGLSIKLDLLGGEPQVAGGLDVLLSDATPRITPRDVAEAMLKDVSFKHRIDAAEVHAEEDEKVQLAAQVDEVSTVTPILRPMYTSLEKPLYKAVGADGPVQLTTRVDEYGQLKMAWDVTAESDAAPTAHAGMTKLRQLYFSQLDGALFSRYEALADAKLEAELKMLPVNVTQGGSERVSQEQSMYRPMHAPLQKSL